MSGLIVSNSQPCLDRLTKVISSTGITNLHTLCSPSGAEAKNVINTFVNSIKNDTQGAQKRIVIIWQGLGKECLCPSTTDTIKFLVTKDMQDNGQNGIPYDWFRQTLKPLCVNNNQVFVLLDCCWFRGKVSWQSSQSSLTAYDPVTAHTTTLDITGNQTQGDNAPPLTTLCDPYNPSQGVDKQLQKQVDEYEDTDDSAYPLLKSSTDHTPAYAFPNLNTTVFTEALCNSLNYLTQTRNLGYMTCLDFYWIVRFQVESLSKQFLGVVQRPQLEGWNAALKTRLFVESATGSVFQLHRETQMNCIAHTPKYLLSSQGQCNAALHDCVVRAAFKVDDMVHQVGYTGGQAGLSLLEATEIPTPTVLQNVTGPILFGVKITTPKGKVTDVNKLFDALAGGDESKRALYTQILDIRFSEIVSSTKPQTDNYFLMFHLKWVINPNHNTQALWTVTEIPTEREFPGGAPRPFLYPEQMTTEVVIGMLQNSVHYRTCQLIPYINGKFLGSLTEVPEFSIIVRDKHEHANNKVIATLDKTTTPHHENYYCVEMCATIDTDDRGPFVAFQLEYNCIASLNTYFVMFNRKGAEIVVYDNMHVLTTNETTKLYLGDVASENRVELDELADTDFLRVIVSTRPLSLHNVVQLSWHEEQLDDECALVRHEPKEQQEINLSLGNVELHKPATYVADFYIRPKTLEPPKADENDNQDQAGVDEIEGEPDVPEWTPHRTPPPNMY